MPYLSGLSIAELDDNLFTTGAGSITAVTTRLGFTNTGATTL
jgi:hypothetical protein